MRKTRYIPPTYKEYQSNEFGIVYKKVDSVVPVIMGFVGKQSNSAFHYKYQNEEQADNKVSEFLSGLARWNELKNEHNANRKQRNAEEMAAVKVGDIFSYSWGYDQTNVDFFQVIEKKPKSFVMQEIAQKGYGEAPSGAMSDNVSPVPNSFLADSKPIIKTSFSMPHGCLSKTTENEKHFSSWYA